MLHGKERRAARGASQFRTKLIVRQNGEIFCKPDAKSLRRVFSSLGAIGTDEGLDDDG